jgi:hypothetical protein
MKKTFGLDELDGALRKIGEHLKGPVTSYLIGGCAMTFRGQKVATKDIDLVVVDEEELRQLVRAMETAGFFRVDRIGSEYEQLAAWTIMENPQKMRFDLFNEVVCRALDFSERMESRAEDYGTFSDLSIHLSSAEDIFLFKGITDRPGDLDDMSILAAGGLNWEVIRDECLAQQSSRNWASFLVSKLEKLEDEYDIIAPITGGLREHAEVFQMSGVVTRFLGGEKRSLEEIRDHLKQSYGFSERGIEDELSRLVEHGILHLEETGGKKFYAEASR